MGEFFFSLSFSKPKLEEEKMRGKKIQKTGSFQKGNGFKGIEISDSATTETLK